MATLRGRGFTLKSAGREYGNFHAVVWNRSANTLDAAADPRGIGEAAVRSSSAEKVLGAAAD